MSPILVRPVREQLEHDRIVRLLQARFRRRFDVGINPGVEQNAPVGTGPTAVYPDVVLTSTDRGRKTQTIIEVETVESVNTLEALAQWAPFGRLRPVFHLYVPASMADVAKRLCTDTNIPVGEIHSYHWIGDDMRFVPIYKAPADGRPRGQSQPKKKSKPSAPQSRRTAAKSKAARKVPKRPARSARSSKRK